MLIGIAIIVAFLVVIAYGSSQISSGMFIKAICSLDNKKEVLLTFDDGPNEKITPILLDTLKQLNIKALFFVVGEKAERHPEIIKRIVAEGHIIGNHSYQHNPKYLFFSKQRILEDLQKTDEFLVRNGIKVKYFRPPLGVTNDSLAWAVKRMNYITIGWNIRSFDTRQETREKVLKRILKQLRGGNIILLHDRVEHVEWLVEKIAEEVDRRGMSFAKDLKY